MMLVSSTSNQQTAWMLGHGGVGREEAAQAEGSTCREQEWREEAGLGSNLLQKGSKEFSKQEKSSWGNLVEGATSVILRS